MSIRMSFCAPVCALIVGLSVVANSQPLAAQSPVEAKRRCVIVAAGSVIEHVRRLAGTVVKVAELPSAEDYDACNARALALRSLSVCLVASGEDCPREQFWRERLLGANPQADVQRVAGWRFVKDDREGAVQQLIATHQALVNALPQHRQTFDANLAVELKRHGQQLADDAELAAR